VSSILKALKKIEHRKAETQLPAWPYRINNRESISRHVKRSWRHHTILGILIVVCTVALAGKLYYGSRTNSESASPKTDLSVKKAPPALPDRKPKTDRLRAEVNAETGVNKASPPPIVNREAPPEPSLDTLPAEAFVKAVAEVPQTAPTNNADLTLQALVWSEKPEDRFVGYQ